MKLMSEGELCMLRNFLSELSDSCLMPVELRDTTEDMLRIVEHTLNKEDIDGLGE